ncbi:SAGA complex/transcription factor TFIID complex subunit A Taf12 [Schizosaccharomyces pombe]|uniref:SAGA complex/transcription factor TFIID complex subunit Taf12 n=1 Tax=Schizosaccharomyces pombe (strain 972 / ATCC 24843) TaxID=284812 RepID=TAF12_SCHPO|nr:transcription factor TFIID complex subunit A/ SAGA complex subunit [Schizosaccharomyces pombe]O13722.1 RecName: Full=Transcription initiation factor TFIID subunit 12; AltName: Full=TBP-associated factor 12 [Schizosaccharomyces pombe 972h-]CAB10099.1 transcription factor TFIID complex subunit A/ SAGA complex subunit [Schizosaccharomyces pombe]|eukprot:NP_594289.1 transcription factor TFIID complex subunit A/ SAGA complex subunit [Schizosaccharomyces pombe]
MNGQHSSPGTPVQRPSAGPVNQAQFSQQRTNQLTSLLHTMTMYQQLAQNVGLNTPQGQVYLLQAQTIRRQLQGHAQSGQLPNQQLLQQLQSNGALQQGTPEPSNTRPRPQLNAQEQTMLLVRHRQLQTAQNYLTEMKEALGRIKNELSTNERLDTSAREALVKQESELTVKIAQFTAAISNGIRSIQQLQNRQASSANGNNTGTSTPVNASTDTRKSTASTPQLQQTQAQANAPQQRINPETSSVPETPVGVSAANVSNESTELATSATQQSGLANNVEKSQTPSYMSANHLPKVDSKSPIPFSVPPSRATLTGGYASGSIGLSTPGLSRAPHYELDNGNRLLSKRKLHDLLQQIDSEEKIEPEVEELLLEIADEFVESVTNFACRLAKHRKSDTLDVRDVQLHLERNWNIRLPGFASDDIVKSARKTGPTPSYQQKQNAIGTAKSLNKD